MYMQVISVIYPLPCTNVNKYGYTNYFILISIKAAFLKVLGMVPNGYLKVFYICLQQTRWFRYFIVPYII